MTAPSVSDPRRSYPPRPVADDVSAELVDEAVRSLVIMRAPMYLGDACAELNALLSLTAEIEARLPGVVKQARDQDTPWSAIARQLGVSVPEARHCYGQRKDCYP